MEERSVETEAVELESVRSVVLAAYPDAVPELIRGATVQELLDAIEPAREAYARVAASVAEATEAAVTAPPAVPAAEKVRRGIAGRMR